MINNQQQMTNNILALDFDGVICDGLLEYFQSSKQTYLQIWPQDHPDKLDEFAEDFYRLRPVVEVGWEMPILLRALMLGIEREQILYDWSAVALQIVEAEGLDKQTVMAKLDTVRDSWIASDLNSWLELHRFYPGVVKRLGEIIDSPVKLYIVTTKEGRFVKTLLQRQGLELPASSIIGKECQRPKYETLRELLEINSLPPEQLWFVEDLLKTLRSVQQQPELQGIKLYLAAWGYNTQQVRDSISSDSRIKLLSLEQFQQDFSAWPCFPILRDILV